MNAFNARSASVPLAIVGVGALFPGSPDTGDFWRTIVRGIDRMSEVPPNYWLIDDYYDPDPSASLKTYARRGGFIDKVPFDTLDNGIPPANVPMTDSTQLLAMIVAKRVLEDACGVGLGRLDRARTSVILGVAGGSTLLGSMCSALQRPIWTKALRESGLPETQVQAICAAIEANYTPWTESTFPGLLGNVIAGRVASRFDLGGTNCTVDAACASSLAAFRMAAQELQLGTADLVITGGVDATNDPLMFTCFSKTPALSRSGDCRPFSEDSDGTMLGEGVGLFAVRRLDDAERDGDNIYAVVRGMGASSDGRAKSIYAPRAEGQMKALRRAYQEAGYSPADVELVEAHGTGTAAGDQAEVEALKAVFAEAGGGARGWCALGSVKSQIGHTKSAAGAASLYKVVMALHHKVLPPTIKISRPNPVLGLDGSAFQLSTAARPWIRDSDRPRRAGVSSFGFGGSNYHMTVEEYLGANRPARIRALPAELVLASGPDPRGAIAAARAVLESAERPGGFAIAARDSQRSFDHRAPVRIAFVAADAAELSGQIADLVPRLGDAPVRLPRVMATVGSVQPGGLGFLFPGQGSQYVGMGTDIALAFASARMAWDAAASDPAPGYDGLHRLTFPATAFDEAEKARQADALTATDIAQPAIGVTSQMMLSLAKSAGLRPLAVAGHSFGELSALHCAGVLDAAGLRAAARQRGALMAEAARVTEGAMLAVFLGKAEIEAILARLGVPGIVIANHNAPEQVVLAGPVAPIEEVARQLTLLDKAHRRLPVATAFHSPIVAPASAPFRAALEHVAIGHPTLPVYGCGTAAAYPTGPQAIRDQLARQLTEPVRFVEQVEAMYEAGVTTFLEVGPGGTLTELTSRILAGRPHLALSMDRRNRNGVVQLWETLGALAVAGHALDFGFAWEGYADEAPAPAKLNAATVMIDGANYRKPYPPAGGSAALPPPNPVAAAPEPTTEPAQIIPSAPGQGEAMPNDAHAARTAALLEALRINAEAHSASQQAMATAHMAYLRQTQELIGQLSGVPMPGLELAEMTAALTPLTRNLAPADEPIASAPAPAAVSPPIKQAQAIRDPVLPAPVPAPAAASKPSPLSGVLLGIVADKTGYPVAMLSPEMELEADLGVDSIKRVEILAAFRAVAPNLPEVDPRDLAGLRTLSAILERLGGVAPAAPSQIHPVAAPVVAQPSPAPSQAADPALASIMLGIVAEKTGYPVAMLSPEMELEADLGVDSIKRVEILAAFRAAAPNLPEVDPRELAGLRTLSAILERLGGVAPAAPSQIHPVAAAIAHPSPPSAGQTANQALASILLGIVADKTGYPVGMLTPEMDLEADLGVDSIKRVEILAAFRAAAPNLPEVDPRDLAGLRTLSAILERLGGVAPAAPSPSHPVSAPVAAPPSPAPSQAADSALASILLGIVAEKTGYPVGMLSPEMELEADLGVDSIKRVEILAAFRAAAPNLPEVDPRDLAGLRTLSAILERLGGVAPAAPTPIHPVAAPTIPQPSPAPSHAADSALTSILLGIVADKTGYPVGMLSPEMELEADLGVDSIKRVEILAAFRAAAPNLPEVDPRDLASLRTLSAIIGRLGMATGEAATQMPPPMQRIGIVEAPAGEAGAPLLAMGGAVALVGDGAGLAGTLAEALGQAGVRVLQGDDIAAAQAVIVLHGLDRAGDSEAIARSHLLTFAAARAFASRAATIGGSFVTLQDTGGAFALGGGGQGAWLGGMAGIAKTAAAEWPLANVRAIDLQRAGQSPHILARRLVAELLGAGGGLEIGLRSDGRRVTLAERPLDRTPGFGPALKQGAVLVVSGGARGVVASCLLALAPQLRPRLLLLGRTVLRQEPVGLPPGASKTELSQALYEIALQHGRRPAPRELSAEVAEIIAVREVRGTIDALEKAGAEVRYRGVDVSDRIALDGALAETRLAWGAIDGVVHGAGVLADRLIADQTDEQFLRVFRTKVDGLRALLDATRRDPLSRLCMFSSVAGRYGNPGQVAYAAANEVLNKVAQEEAVQRGGACRVISLNWGPWDGGMVTDGLREAFAKRGVPLIAVPEGAKAFVSEMLGSGGEAAESVEILLGGRLAPAEATDAAFAR